MAEISAKLVMTLREKTNAGMMECKKALTEAAGDLEKAEVILRKSGTIKAEKKADRQTKEGIIASYIHMAGRIGVLIEVNCETDFVARNENFQALVKDISLHIAASNPRFLQREDVPADLVAKEREIGAELVKGKPANIVDKIVDAGCRRLLLTERGTTFGYNNLVADMRSLPIMRSFGFPVIFDATHSVQAPGGAGDRSGGDARFAPVLARAAVAAGCDGIFIETHPDPSAALSDGPNMIPLRDMRGVLENLCAIQKTLR